MKCIHCGGIYEPLDLDDYAQRLYCSPACFNCHESKKRGEVEELGLLCNKCKEKINAKKNNLS